MRPSPARVEAPEPDVWLPILDITGELLNLAAEIEALDITVEIEELDLDAHRADFDAELRSHQAIFWSSAPLGLEAAVIEITSSEPIELAVPVEVTAFAAPTAPAVDDSPAPPAPGSALPAVPEPIETAPETRTEPQPAALRHRIASSLHGADLRTRLVATLLVLALLAALASVAPSVVGASVPQRYVTITLDGQTVARTVRLATVSEVLAQEGISVGPDDRVIPAPSTELHEGMHIRVLRAFPVDVDVDGSVTTVRTTARSAAALRRSLGLDEVLVADGSSRLAAGATVAFRTPHNVSVQVDGRTIEAPRSKALDVAGLLAEQGIPLGARDEVLPAADTRLTDGLHVQVFRLADNQVAERVAVPFTTDVRDDPNLPAGQTRTITAGVNGLRRDIFQVTTRDDGTVVEKQQIGSELLTPPVARVVVKGTQPLPADAGGSATWYGTGPGPGTCAHLTLKFGTIVTLTNRSNGNVATCRVADRGPETWTGHIIDLSPDVFRRLAPLSQGVIPSLALSY